MVTGDGVRGLFASREGSEPEILAGLEGTQIGVSSLLAHAARPNRIAMARCRIPIFP